MITKNELKKNTINALLTTNNNSKFIIPEYQRPYVWDEDKASKLVDDIWEFTLEQKNINTDETYFLGSLVACEYRHNIEIIDGQQRLTSIFLLLRAIYTKLSQEDENEKTKNLMNRIAPTLWEVDKKTNKPDYKKPLLITKVFDDSGNEILKKILETGEINIDAKDNYSKNYLEYIELYDKLAKENRHRLDDFIILLLDNTILLPIITDREDIALTIFSTLNDRGEPLTNADKFKAEIYKKLDNSKRKEFIENWRELERKVNNIKDGSMQTLFYYYMFYVRAKKGDEGTTTPGLGDFFLKNNKEVLYDVNLLDNLGKILDFVTILDSREEDESLPWSKNKEILKLLDVLFEYPNEFWKYPVITYYLQYNTKKDFEVEFLKFLKEFIVLLVVRYVNNPSVNGIKPDIAKLDVSIIKSNHPTFPEIDFDNNDLRMELKTPNSKLVRMLLTIMAYMEPSQKELLENRKWEIEHIFPQKWHSNYFPKNKSENDIKETIEHLGNKVPLKKKLNIVAGKNYIDKKVLAYAESKIKVAYKLKDLKDWSLEHISQRDADVTKAIIDLFKKYIKDYNKSN